MLTVRSWLQFDRCSSTVSAAYDTEILFGPIKSFFRNDFVDVLASPCECHDFFTFGLFEIYPCFIV